MTVAAPVGQRLVLSAGRALWPPASYRTLRHGAEALRSDWLSIRNNYKPISSEIKKIQESTEKIFQRRSAKYATLPAVPLIICVT